MKVTNSIALVTGASRGIGRALVTALLEAGAAKVYAGARNVRDLTKLVAESGGRVVALEIDVTKPATIETAALRAEGVNLLINNAGLLSAYDLLTTSRATLDREFETNFHGPLAVTRAFVPMIEQSGGGAIVNVLTVVALASMPGLGGYSATKAAALSLTQALRPALAKRNIAVHAVYPGPVDTDMAKDITLPKTSPLTVARAIVEGVSRGDEDILPDAMSQEVFGNWKTNPKAVERMFGAL